MNVKYFTFGTSAIIIALVVIMFGCNSCCNTPPHYEVRMKESPPMPKIDTVNLYVETSLSMKGYVDEAGAANHDDFKFAEKVYDLMSKLGQHYQVKLFTITDDDEPTQRKLAVDAFYDELRAGGAWFGKSSKIHEMFIRLIDSLKPSSTNILISDCILDMGNGATMEDRKLATKKIQGNLLGRNINSSCYLFYSAFNGDYYFDRNNTRPMPYSGEILDERPYYIWVLSSDNNAALQSILSGDILAHAEKEAHFNYSNNHVKCVLLKYPKEGYIRVDTAGMKFTITEMRELRKQDIKSGASITLGLDLSSLPSSYQDIEYLRRNLEVSSEVIRKHSKLAVYTENEIIAKCNDPRQVTFLEHSIEDNQLTNFVTVTFIGEKPPAKNFKLQLKREYPSWISSVSINDDLGVTQEELKGKTFSFNYICDAFDGANEDSIIFEIEFNYDLK